jgi:hypothetical protein
MADAQAILKGQIEEWLLAAGLLLCLGSGIIGLLKIRNARIPGELGDLARVSADFLGKFLPLALICGLLFSSGAIWYAMKPDLIGPRNLEQVIVRQQLQRAKTIRGAECIVIGDSSALMGVDAPLLSCLLRGRRVENISTLGWVGPRGYAHLLKMYFERGQSAKTVILLMHSGSLDRPEGLGWEKWEDAVVNERDLQWKQEDLVDGLRSKLGAVFLGRLLALPMPAAWGRYYGTDLEVGAAIRENAGSIYEPSLELPESAASALRAGLRGRQPNFRLSPSADAGITDFARSTSLLPVEHVLFGITPTPLFEETNRGTLEKKQLEEQVGSILRASLGSRLELLHLEPFEADEYFSSEAHLNESGRARFTRMLAEKLASMD